jgi:hypothetical protein
MSRALVGWLAALVVSYRPLPPSRVVARPNAKTTRRAAERKKAKREKKR